MTTSDNVGNVITAASPGAAALSVISIVGVVVMVLLFGDVDGINGRWRKATSKWPPGPARLPMVGNLHQLSARGSLLFAVTEMAKRYGPVMTIWMGRVPTVVVSGQEAAWEALVTQASNFATRPVVYSRQFLSAGFRTTATSQYNAHWTKLRKVIQNHVLSPLQLSGQSSSHQRDVGILMERLEEEMKERHGVVRPLHSLKLMAVFFIARLCFGPDFHDDTFAEKLEQLIAQDIKLNGQTLLLDTLPFTRHFVPSSAAVERKYKALRGHITDLIFPLIHQARQRQRQSKSPNCYLTSLLSAQAEEEQDDEFSEMSDEEISLNLFELFVLSVDSTSTALEWSLAYMVRNPDVQRRAYEELTSIIQPREREREREVRCVSVEDLGKLPYLQAIVKETLRKEGIAPLGLPHKTVKECKLMGINIPAGTQVIFNLYAISNDAAIWSEPDTFKPERFYGEHCEGVRAKLAYLPFGAGRRICAGMDVAYMHVPLTLANLVNKFEWSCVEDGLLPDMTPDVTMFLKSMKRPLQARIKLRC